MSFIKLHNKAKTHKVGTAVNAYLNLSHLAVLEALQKESQTMKELALLLEISTAGITGRVDALESGGYIQRQDDEDDRRVTWVTITGKGNKALNTIKNAR